MSPISPQLQYYKILPKFTTYCRILQICKFCQCFYTSNQGPFTNYVIFFQEWENPVVFNKKKNAMKNTSSEDARRSLIAIIMIQQKMFVYMHIYNICVRNVSKNDVIFLVEGWGLSKKLHQIRGVRGVQRVKNYYAIFERSLEYQTACMSKIPQW